MRAEANRVKAEAVNEATRLRMEAEADAVRSRARLDAERMRDEARLDVDRLDDVRSRTQARDPTPGEGPPGVGRFRRCRRRRAAFGGAEWLVCSAVPTCDRTRRRTRMRAILVARCRSRALSATPCPTGPHRRWPRRANG